MLAALIATSLVAGGGSLPADQDGAVAIMVDRHRAAPGSAVELKVSGIEESAVVVARCESLGLRHLPLGPSIHGPLDQRGTLIGIPGHARLGAHRVVVQVIDAAGNIRQGTVALRITPESGV